MDHHLAAVACDLSLFFCGDNLNLVGGKPKDFKTARGSGSNAIAMLSDASGENEKIGSPQQSHIGPDCLSDRKGEDIQSKTRLRVPGTGSFFQRNLTYSGVRWIIAFAA